MQPENDIVVSKEIAEKEFHEWLDHKKITGKLRETLYAAYGQIFISLICDGTFVLDTATFTITHKLLFPLGKSQLATSVVTYQPRMSVGAYSKNLAFAGADNTEGEFIAKLATLAGLPYAEMALIDSEDFRRARVIAFFFQT